MNRLLKIGASTLLSGGIISHGSLSGYVGDAARRAAGMGLAHLQDGAVYYFGKNVNLLERGLIQTAHQLAYGMLRSYPRYLLYWEQRVRDKYLETQSQTSLANKSGQYYRLISEQRVVAAEKNHTDTIVGRIVQDFLELEVPQTGHYFDQKTGKLEDNRNYGASIFVDLQPQIQVSTKNNVVLTTVQGRDFTRKELVSGGDYEITINGKITSKYPDVYPDAEVSKFLKLMQYRGVLTCDNTILRQFNISRLIVLNYSLPSTECRNVQPYTLTCVAVEPSEAVSVKLADAEVVDEAIKHTNKWLKYLKIGAEVVDPSLLLHFSPWV